MNTYQYLILRYVHNFSTEEFVNIGVVMWVPEERRLLFEVCEKYSRLSQFFDSFDGVAYRNMVHDFKARLRSAETNERVQEMESIERVAEVVLPRDPSCFQWSSAMSGVTENPEGRLGEIYNRIIDRHFEKRKRIRRAESDIYRNVYHRLRQLLNRDLLERKISQNITIEGTHFPHTFKLGWQNGTPQFLEPISFDYAEGSELVDKAYEWSGRLKDLEGKLDFKMTGVVAAPQEEELLDRYREALEILRESTRVRALVPEEEFDQFVPEIERDLQDGSQSENESS